MNKFKKAIALGVMLMTVLSLTVVAAPAGAAVAKAGDLIKADGLSSVYYLAADGKRYVFPNETTYFSWYSDFSGVVTIPYTELTSYPLGKNVTVRPGTRLVKITTDPKVYAVEPNGSLVWVSSEAAAKTLWGDNWAKRVSDVPDAFFTNYTVITSKQVSSTAYPAGSLVKFGAAADVYYINTDGTASKIANEAAFNANRFNWNNVISSAMAVPALGAEIAAANATITDTSSGAGGVAGSGTGLTVALSANTAVSASVPNNGARVPMATVNVTASNDGDVTVSSIVVKRIGLSQYNNMTAIWAEKAGVVVASKKTVNSNDEATLTFSPALTVAKGQTVALDLIASLGNSASGNIGISIAAASAVSAGGATVSGSFPINGNLMSPISYSVSNIGFSATSTTALTVKVGDEKAELGKFVMDFNTTNTNKDVTIKSIMLKNNGIEDLAKTSMNLYLEYNGAKVSDSAVVNGRYVTFYFPAAGFDMLKDDGSKTFYIKGDVIAKESTATNSYSFALNKATDFSAIEKSTGFGVNVYNATTGTTLADGKTISEVTITAGVLTISKKAVSPSDTTIIKGSDNVVLLANVRADEAINADGLAIKYGSSASAAATVTQFENVRVYLNGLLVDSFDPAATSSSLIDKAFSSSVSLNKGDNEVKVMVKAKSNAAASSAFMAKLDSATMFASQNAQYVSSGNAVSASDISGTATGGIFTVQGAVLTTVRNDGYAAAKPVVAGAADISVGRFALKATNDEIKVTSIAFGANASSTVASALYDAKLYVDGVQVGNVVDFGSSGATFSSLNITIAKDATKVVELKVSFDAAATGGFQTTMTVNAQDSRGTAISSGNTATTTTFAVLTSGSLTVELGGNTPDAAILAAKAVEQEVAQFKFTAINDAAALTEINFVNNASSTGVEATNAADSLISAVRLYDGATLIDETLLVSGAGMFNATGKVTVPANSYKTLSVKVVMNPIANDATATNKDLQFTLTTVKFKSSAGTVTGPQTENDKANSFRIRKTVPTVTLVALPDTLLSAGDKVVSKFKVAADAAGDVALKQVVLKYATTTNSGVATLASNAVKVNDSVKAVAATVDTDAKTITVTFATPETIAAGTEKTFEILATVSVSGTGSESVTTKIEEDAAYATNGTGNFVWSDGADISAYTYSNGKRVKGLTTNTQALTK